MDRHYTVFMVYRRDDLMSASDKKMDEVKTHDPMNIERNKAAYARPGSLNCADLPTDGHFDLVANLRP